MLTPPERRELKRKARKRSLAVELVKRAEVILMLASGHSYREVRQRVDCSDEYIRECKKRFQEERLVVEISPDLRLAFCHTPSTSVSFVLSYSEGLW